MDFDTFKRAVDSMVGFNGLQGCGFMGGECLFHPEFERFARYAADKLGPEKMGLWSCFPPEKAHLGQVIADCFGAVFPNDHSRVDVIHSPFLVSIKEVHPPEEMWYRVENCWAWHSWSASINIHGAYACEIAASMAALFNDPETAWPVESGWWKRTPKDYREQMEKWCPECGGALCGARASWGRSSKETVDDISPGMLKRLEAVGSPKVKRGEFVVHDLKPIQECRRMATYKEEGYRQAIVRPYGLFLMLNQKGFMTPFPKIVTAQTKAFEFQEGGQDETISE